MTPETAMAVTAPPPVAQGDVRQMIPDVMSLRRIIGVKSAELSVLRRLLRVAESNARLDQQTATDTSPTHATSR